MSFIWSSINRAARIALPQLRKTVSESPAVRQIKMRAIPSIQEAGGSVEISPQDGGAGAAIPTWTEHSLPKSIEMLTANRISVQPSLLLQALPWASLVATAPDEHEAHKVHGDLKRWKDLGHLVNPQLAVDICKKVATWMSLREIQRVLDCAPQGPLGVVRDALEQNNMEVSRLADRHAKISALLAEGRVAEAYARAQSALRSLESMHHLLESARLRALEARRNTSERQRMLWAVSGSAVVLGLACEFLASVPIGEVSTLLPVLRDTIATGAVICLTMASYLQLVSPDFAAYLARFRDAQDERIRLRLRLEEDINECLDQGFVPTS